jgi:hypothetical protein
MYRHAMGENCYGYATGSGTFRQPDPLDSIYGHSSQVGLARALTSGGGPFTNQNVAKVRSLMEGTWGPKMADPNGPCPPGYHKIACYATPDTLSPMDPENAQPWDFHFYKYDPKSRLWSHKPGMTPIRKFDDSCNPITDPAKADRGMYSQHVGTWLVPNTEDNSTADYPNYGNDEENRAQTIHHLMMMSVLDPQGHALNMAPEFIMHDDDAEPRLQMDMPVDIPGGPQ